MVTHRTWLTFLAAEAHPDMNEVLADTLASVNHFRCGNDSMADFLSLDMAMTHAMLATALFCWPLS